MAIQLPPSRESVQSIDPVVVREMTATLSMSAPNIDRVAKREIEATLFVLSRCYMFASLRDMLECAT